MTYTVIMKISIKGYLKVFSMYKNLGTFKLIYSDHKWLFHKVNILLKRKVLGI